jgi:hypothetical protein
VASGSKRRRRKMGIALGVDLLRPLGNGVAGAASPLA